MPSNLYDLGTCLSLSEYADDLFLESALNSSCNLEPLGPLFLGPTPSQSPSHPSSEDSFYPDNTPVLSDEIWKKFDLPADEASPQWSCTDEDSLDWNTLLPPGLHSAITVVLEAGKLRPSTSGKELRHHDCMWAGECKNKEHVRNRIKTAGAGDQRVIAPGQTLLKNPVLSKETPSTVPSVMMKATSPMLTASPTVLRVPRGGGGMVGRTIGKSVLVRTPSRAGGRPGEAMPARVITLSVPAEEKESRGGKKSTGTSSTRSLCSEGSSPRPETPLSLSEEEDDEGGTARCDASGRGASVRGQTAEDLEEAEAAAAFAEAMALAAEEDEECGEAVSVTEVTGQVRMSGGGAATTPDNTEKPNACYLDHDYHKSNNNNTKGAAVKTDHLGVQTPSDSEEEIDVVSCTGGDKTAIVRPSSVATAPRATNKAAIVSGRQTGRVNLPTNPSARDKHQLQLTVEAAIAKVSANAAAGFDDDDDEEYGDSDEEEEEVESEDEEEEEEYEYDSSEGAREQQQNLHHSNGRQNGGKTNSSGAKRHASSDDSGPAAKQSRVGHHHHHKRRRRQPREEDPDYDGHSTPGWSFSTSYLSSSSSGTSSPPRRRGGHRKRPHRHHHEAGDSAPEDPLERRSMHNTMERQRRIDLRNAFENLRLLVPAVSEKERAAKVTILREAAGFCTQLTTQGGKQVDTLKALRARQVALRAQVSSLRRSLAASR